MVIIDEQGLIVDNRIIAYKELCGMFKYYHDKNRLLGVENDENILNLGGCTVEHYGKPSEYIVLSSDYIIHRGSFDEQPDIEVCASDRLDIEGSCVVYSTYTDRGITYIVSKDNIPLLVFPLLVTGAWNIVCRDKNMFLVIHLIMLAIQLGYFL